ncbi:MAG: hypothetical protein O7D32_09360 [bacterium]|nr:hypothetical protein [bacterium]
MRKRSLVVFAGAATVGACIIWLTQSIPSSAGTHVSSTATANPAVPSSTDSDSSGEPGCQAGCSITNHPIEPLTDSDYHSLIRSVAVGGDAERVHALETLLFHGPQVGDLIDRLGTGPLADSEVETLRHELSKTHVRLWMRLVDQEGVVRASIENERFLIAEKTHVHFPDTQDMDALEISGTIFRTGLHHLWTRM